MQFYFPEGSRLYYSNTLAAAKTISALSNAADAVATSTSHGYVDNDEVLYEGGWEDADGMVFRADQQDANSFKLLGLDSQDTDFYPSGTGTGTAKKISDWVQVPRMKNDISTDGGDPRFVDINLLARRQGIRVPVGFNASNFNVSIYDDPTDSTITAMLALSRKLSPVAFKMVVSGGATSYGYGYMALSEIPRQQQGDANTRALSIALVGRWQTYTS